MSSWSETTIKEINSREPAGIEPMRFPDETFELYSVPSFEFKEPEIILGVDIGSTKQIVEEGDVLICKINPRINRVWIVGNMGNKTGHRKIASSEWIVVNTKGVIDSKYLMYEFSSPFFRKLLESEVSGVGGSLTRARPKLVENYLFPLAPLPEQKRIVAKLDKLFAHLDQLKARLQNIPTLLKQFRQAVLTQSVTGRLTEDWRMKQQIDVSDLFKKIQAKRETLIEKSEKHKNKATVAYVKDAEPIHESPAEWRWLTLNSICDPTRALTYGVIKLGQEVENGVPCLRTSDVRPLRILLSDVKRISKQIADEYSRTYLKGGEILINVRGTLGGIAVAPIDIKGYNVSREIAVAPILPIINPHYIAFYVAAPITQNWLMDVAKGIAYTGINIEDLINLPVPIPPLEEQNEIVRRVNSLFALADRIEQSFTALQGKIEQLPQAILSKAFMGQLFKSN
jgi:type I restriction enzyme, S subunit